MAHYWNKNGVPHGGWNYVRTIDHEEATQTCDMCGKKHIRYIDVVSHPNHEDLNVGQECSAIMCGYPDGTLRYPIKEIILIVPNNELWQVMCINSGRKVNRTFESRKAAGLWIFDNIICEEICPSHHNK